MLHVESPPTPAWICLIKPFHRCFSACETVQSCPFNRTFNHSVYFSHISVNIICSRIICSPTLSTFKWCIFPKSSFVSCLEGIRLYFWFWKWTISFFSRKVVHLIRNISPLRETKLVINCILRIPSCKTFLAYILLYFHHNYEPHHLILRNMLRNMPCPPTFSCFCLNHWSTIFRVFREFIIITYYSRLIVLYVFVWKLENRFNLSFS